MQKGKITGQARTGKANIFGEFHIEFPTKAYGPYSHVFTRENLYYSNELSDRGSSLFPLKEKEFDNTEIFLERDDIVVCCGVRGSFSGQERQFIEFVNLETGSKKRLYAEEVSLIYNTQETLIVCFHEKSTWKKREYSSKDFSLMSETKEHISAFFKLLYNHDEKKYYRIIYEKLNQLFIKEDIGESEDEQYGYFLIEEIVQKLGNEIISPKYFIKKEFLLQVKKGYSEIYNIDIWESSLTGKI